MKDKLKIGTQNVERTLAANSIAQENHLKEIQEQNDIFIKHYEEKLKELDSIDRYSFPDVYDKLQKEVSKMAVAIKINENTIESLKAGV